MNAHCFSLNNKVGLKDYQDNIILDAKYDEIVLLSYADAAIIRVGGLWGAIDLLEK